MTLEIHLLDGEVFALEDVYSYSLLPGWLSVFFEDESQAFYPSLHIDMVSA